MKAKIIIESFMSPDTPAVTYDAEVQEVFDITKGVMFVLNNKTYVIKPAITDRVTVILSE